jgi:hypothetical protein
MRVAGAEATDDVLGAAVGADTGVADTVGAGAGPVVDGALRSDVGVSHAVRTVDAAAGATIGAVTPTASAPTAIAAMGISRILRDDFRACLFGEFFFSRISLPLPHG